MLVAQAERQFELWTGQRPPVGLFAAAAASATGQGPREITIEDRIQ
jgi:shikimate 5-dehydrogenase